MTAKILKAEISSAFLPEAGDLRRLPRAPNRKRPQKFWHAFEDRALVYDCFWHQDGKRVLMVCPPPVNLVDYWQSAKISAFPQGKKLQRQLHVARSSMIVELKDVPKQTTSVELSFGQRAYTIPIRPNLAEEFSGCRILFSMNKNNDLAWIKEWASFHQVMHEVDTIILFDNGSTAYSISQIEQILLEVDGLKKILIIPFPYRFGAKDPKVVMHPYWAHFLQNASFSLLLRRMAGDSLGILNMDVDELAAPIPGGDVFSFTQESTTGFHVLNGTWVENILPNDDRTKKTKHSDYRHILRDFRAGLNAKKWALDPSREWLQDLSLQPTWHKIKHMPKELVSASGISNYWHFRGINTNWKKQQNLVRKSSVFCKIDRELLHTLSKYKSKHTNSKERS